MLPLGYIVNKCKGISCYCYGDDIQLYVSFKPGFYAQWPFCMLVWQPLRTGWLNTYQTEVLIIVYQGLVFVILCVFKVVAYAL